jgi:ATP-binding cassette subfamily B protein
VLSASIYFVNTVISKRSEQIQASLSQLSKFTQEAFSGIRVLKAFARENDNASKFIDESNEYRNRSMQLSFVNALFFPLMFGLIGLSTILTIYYGGLEVNRGNITTGNIAEFIIYINMLTWPVTSLGWVMSIAQRSTVSQTRINEFLEVKTDILSLQNLEEPIQGAIRFDKVSFTYPDSGIQALKSVSFNVKPGQSIAIMGTTGSGKTTIANLLARMYDPNEGMILIDEIDARNFNIGHLRRNMAQVPQDVFLFSDSIANNVAFGFPDGQASEHAIIEAVKDADLFDNLEYFPDGLQTKIGERGITLSGGQKQRVSIARALILNPKILVLDDSLSAVDTKTENAILNNLKKVMAGKTTVIISHRISSAKLADHILFMDDGHIVEEGTHEELVSKPGMYRDLFEKQLTTEQEA